MSARHDAFRQKTSPNAVKVHAFSASSDFEAAQKSYAWHGWGVWKPEPDWAEEFYTDEEAETQKCYLAVRIPHQP